MGHVLACQFALSAWKLDRILVVPSYLHAFGKPLEAYEHRFRMCMLAFAGLQHVEVSRVEETLGGVSYTVETLHALSRDFPGSQLRLLVGSDILAETNKWKNFEQIVALAPLLVLPRGADAGGVCGAYLPPISSTQLREALAADQNPCPALPWRVFEYIRDRGLYVRRAATNA